MASPFPGMDPYLERHWGDVHARLVIYACDQLQSRLPRDLRARVEERVFMEAAQPLGKVLIPDVRVEQRRGHRATAALSYQSVDVAEPVIVVLDETTEGFIEIRDIGAGRRLVTVIEFLSPSNKLPGEGKKEYLKKRKELRENGINLVEIDLTRRGRRPLPIPLERLPERCRSPYLAWARRGGNPREVEFYSLPLQQPLPSLPIPLRPTDDDVPLRLQPLVEEAYRKGAYENDLDYQQDPEPPLKGVDARWADALLREKKLRSGRRPASRGNGQRKKPS